MNPESLLVKIAEREIGAREEGAENCGPRVREYQRATWLEPGPWSWCAAWTAWSIREWIAFPEVRHSLGLGSPSEADRWRPKNPSAFSFERWARDHGQLVLPATEPTLAYVKDIKVAQSALLPFMSTLTPLRAFSSNFSPEAADKLDTLRAPVVGAPSGSSDFAGSYTRACPKSARFQAQPVLGLPAAA